MKETRNRGLEEKQEQLNDAEQRLPRHAVDKDGPEQERVTTTAEEAGEDIAQLENPPQVEGPRERSNDAV